MLSGNIADVLWPRSVDRLPSLADKVIAVTGCTTGTGYWLAVTAVKKGARCIILLNRKSERATSAEQSIKENVLPGAASSYVVSVDCDLQSMASVRAAAAEVAKVSSTYGGLDVLVNNAGVMMQPDHRTTDGFDVQMQTNHLSHFLLTKMLMPSLEMAAFSRGEARVVQHSSGARRSSTAGEGLLESKFFQRSEPATLGADGLGAGMSRYHQTKLANSVFGLALHNKLSARGSKVKSVVAEPGVSATKLFENIATGHAEGGLANRIALNCLAPCLMSIQGCFGNGPQSAADGSVPLCEAAFGSETDSGDFFMPTVPLWPIGSKGDPNKVLTAGVPSGLSWQKDKFRSEDLTLDVGNHHTLWVASEAAIGEAFEA